MTRFEIYFARFGCVVVLVVAALLVGCASPGSPFAGWYAPPYGKAMLYVYRSSQFEENTVYAVKVDGVKVGRLHHDGYVAVPIAAGEREIHLQEVPYRAGATAPLRIHAEAGKIYPVEYDASEVRFGYEGFGGLQMHGEPKVVLRTTQAALPVLRTRKNSSE